MAHLLKLVDKMYKYKVDPASIMEDTERTRFWPQMDRRKDGQTDGRVETNWEVGDIINVYRVMSLIVLKNISIDNVIYDTDFPYVPQIQYILT